MIRALKGVIWYHRGLEIPSLSNTSSRESSAARMRLGVGVPEGTQRENRRFVKEGDSTFRAGSISEVKSRKGGSPLDRGWFPRGDASAKHQIEEDGGKIQNVSSTIWL